MTRMKIGDPVPAIPAKTWWENLHEMTKEALVTKAMHLGLVKSKRQARKIPKGELLTLVLGRVT